VSAGRVGLEIKQPSPHFSSGLIRSTNDAAEKTFLKNRVGIVRALTICLLEDLSGADGTS
jgi:hypothetical protein